MEYNRREYSAALASLGAYSLAGCVRPGSLSGGDREVDDTFIDETEPSPNSEESPQDASRSFDAPHQQIREVVDFTEWKLNHMESSIADFRSRFSSVDEALGSLEDRGVSSLSQSDLDSVFQTADEAADIDTSLARYYSSIPNFSARARQLKSDLQRDYDRSEYTSLEENIDSYRRLYRYYSSTRYTNEQFGRDPLSGDPYQLFTTDEGHEDGEHLFELLYQPHSVESRESFFAAPGSIRLLNEPFNINSEGETVSLRHRDIPIYEFANGLVDLSDYSMTELYLNITRLTLFYEDDLDSYLEGQSVLNIQGNEGLGVAIQQFASHTEAESAFQKYHDAGVKDSEVKLLGYYWDRIFFNQEQPTVYAYIMQRGEYILLLDVVDTPWEERTYGEATDASAEDILAGSLLDSTS